ncbi:DUF6075 family protein [Halalkalibacter alkalisediminis]
MFLNHEHEKEFFSIREEAAGKYKNNKEYMSVAFLMAGNEELKQKMKPYFDMDEGFFKSALMFEKEDFSTSLQVMAKLAVHLFNNNETVDPLDLIGYLDEDNFELALQVIKFRKYGLDQGYTAKDGNMMIR